MLHIHIYTERDNDSMAPHILHTLLAAMVHLAEGLSLSLLKLKVKDCLICLAGTQICKGTNMAINTTIYE